MKKFLISVTMSSLLFAGMPSDVSVVPNKVVIKLSRNVSPVQGKQANTGVERIDRILRRFETVSIEPVFQYNPDRKANLPDINRICVIEYSSELSPFLVAKELSLEKEIKYAEPLFIREIVETPNDPSYGNQWHLPKMKMPDAWSIAHGDATVIVGIVDTGVEITHPDLAANIWTNEAELNGIEGIDDDGNGYIDDLHGWDFYDNDNTLGDGEGHGTHVAGCADAVTNNGVGVSGVAWNVTILPTKHTSDTGGTGIWYGYSGIVYAAENGADVINCSWGGGGESQVEQDVVTYAAGLGSLVVAAAGNSNLADPFFPASLSKVLNVAATTSADKKADFSNYGISIDISSPGVSIYATIPGNSYSYLSGTSMASPVAAGMAALVKSYFPDLSPEELARRVAGTTDNIDDKNPGYEGLLGTGRVNAYRALITPDSSFGTIPPRISVLHTTFTDTVEGNGNGVLDRGETIHLSARLKNWSLGSAGSVHLTLTSFDSEVAIVNGIYSTGAFPEDTSATVENVLSFAIAENATPRMVELALALDVDGSFISSDTFAVAIGRMPVLIVADDKESCCSGFEVEGTYTTILNEREILYGVLDRSKQGAPSGSGLSGFPIVIWFTEWDFPSLDSLDRAALKDYLDSGGNLYISGQDFGWDLNENPGTVEAVSFYSDYLHADWGGDHSGALSVIGEFGDPIGDGLVFDLWQPGLASSNQYPDYFTPDSDAVSIFHYNNGLGFGLRYEGNYRVVYTGMGLEAMGSDLSTTPGDVNDTQRTVLGRILDYLNFIHHSKLSDTEDTSQPFPIYATLSADTSDLESFVLYWKTDEMDGFSEVPMTHDEGNNYSAEIPAPGYETNLHYYFEMSNSYYSWTNPISASYVNTFTFHVGQDTVPPQVTYLSYVDDTIDRSGSAEITAVAVDNIGIGEMLLHWQVSGDSLTNYSPMVNDGNIWRGILSWSNLSGNSVVTYWVRAIDTSMDENISTSEEHSFQIINVATIGKWEDQEISEWNTGDGWGIFYFNAVMGYMVDDSPGSNYQNNADNKLTRIEPVDLSSFESAYLSFKYISLLEANKDFGYLEASSDSLNWDALFSITGMGVTGTSVVDFSEYIPYEKAWVRFRMTSDGQVTKPGFYIDDVFLFVDTTLVASVEDKEVQLPMTVSLNQNYPNPFNPVTRIDFSLPSDNHVTLKVYDILGQEVAVLIEEFMNAGNHGALFSPKDLSAGIYLYRLTVGEEIRVRKAIYMK